MILAIITDGRADAGFNGWRSAGTRRVQSLAARRDYRDVRRVVEAALSSREKPVFSKAASSEGNHQCRP